MFPRNCVALLSPLAVLCAITFATAPARVIAEWPTGWRAGPDGAYGPPIPLTEVRRGNTTYPDPLGPETLTTLEEMLDLPGGVLHWEGGRRIDRVERHDLRFAENGRSAFGPPLRVIISETGSLVAILGDTERLHAPATKATTWPTVDERNGLSARFLAPGQRLKHDREGWWFDGERHVAAIEAVLTGEGLEHQEQLVIEIGSGRILDREDLVRHVDGEGSISAEMPINLSPDVAGTPIFPLPLPHLDVVVSGVGTVTTDVNGLFCVDLGGVPATISGNLWGPFVRVLDASGPEIELSGTLTPGAPLSLILNSTPNEDDTAEVSAFHHVNVAHDWLAAMPISPPFTAMDFPLQTRVSRPSFGTCNAAFDPNVPEIFFLPAGGSCPNTAYSTIITHEYMHAAAWQIFGSLTPSDLHEGIADCGAVLLSIDRDVGRGFFGTGQELRDVEPNLIHPVSGEAHIRGLVLAGSVWDLRTRLAHQLGSAAGTALTAEIWFKSLFFLPAAIDSGLVTVMLLADDDDADLSNGTPHELEIRDSFAIHGLFTDPIPVAPILNHSNFATGSGITFSWSPGAAYTEVIVERDGLPYMTLPGSTTLWTDFSILPGEHTYLFRPMIGAVGAPPTPFFLRQKRFVRGDMNGSGLLSIADVVHILLYVFAGIAPGPCLDAADADDNGNVSIGDAIYILQYMFAGGPPPPAPTPEPVGPTVPGIDPTADALSCGGEA